MKSLRSLLLVVLLGASYGYAQSEAHQHNMDAPKAAAPKSEAQLSFDAIKMLAGEWEGPVSTDMSPEMKKAFGAKSDLKPLHVTMRVTSRGNVLVHEFQEAGTPLDPKQYDHPVTMVYLDQDKLNLVHYCDAGNRPHMVAKVSPDGKTYDFDLVDVSGGLQRGHMAHATFTVIDADRHVEEWTYMLPNNTAIHAKFELHRVQGGIAGTTTSGQ